MRMHSSAPFGQPGVKLLDVTDAYLFSNAGLTDIVFNWLGGYHSGVTSFYDVNTGAAVTRRATPEGIDFIQVTGAAAATKCQSSHFALPFSTKWSGNGGLAQPAFGRQYFRYTYSTNVLRPAFLTAAGAIVGAGTTQFDRTANTVGFWLRAASAVNGGRWTPEFQLANASGIVTGADSGFSATVWRYLKFVFTEGDTPTFTMSIDRQLVFSASGEANMPQGNAGSLCGVAGALEAAAATDFLRLSRSRYIVELVGQTAD